MWQYKPLSPHLSIYEINNSTFSSILHRISGLFNSITLFFLFVYIKIFIWGIKIKHFYFFFNFLLFVLSNIICLFFSYHLFNGYRHFLWDCNKYLNICFVKKSFFFTFVFIFIISILNLSIFFCDK